MTPAGLRAALDLRPDAVEAFDRMVERLRAAEDALVGADDVHKIVAESYHYRDNAAAQIIQATYKARRGAHVAIVPPPRYTPPVPREDRFEPDVPWCRL